MLLCSKGIIPLWTLMLDLSLRSKWVDTAKLCRRRPVYDQRRALARGNPSGSLRSKQRREYGMFPSVCSSLFGALIPL
jgi:hypothetical protein